MDPKPFEDEFPEAAALLVTIIEERRSSQYKYREKIYMPLVPQERNEKCECGSDKKYKKCCALVPSVSDPGAWSMRITKLTDQDVDIYLDSKTPDKRLAPKPAPEPKPSRPHLNVGRIGLSQKLSIATLLASTSLIGIKHVR